MSGLAKVGPIRNQADSIMRVLRSATTVVHLVTLLEDMPVTETEEAAAALGIRLGTLKSRAARARAALAELLR